MALTKVTGDFIETGSITQGHLHSSHGITLDHIGDGSTNTFFTTANARAAISATGSLSYNNSTGVMSFTMPTLNTTNITEGNKLFFTNARVDSRVGSLSTSDLSEGTNLYFTNARAISALTAGTNIAIASNGTISSTDTNTTYTVGDGGLTQNNFTNTLKTKLDGIAASATNVTNTNQLTNGAGFITSADGGNATTLDGIDSSQFLRSDISDTISGGLTMGTQNALVASNYGHGVFGLYNASKMQHVWSMGTAYNLPADGSGGGDMYGLAFTHTNHGGQSKSGLSHQLLVMHNGVTKSAMGAGFWTDGTITTTSHGTSANWNTAYGWGNHASAGYLTSHQSLSGYLPLSGGSLTGSLYLNSNNNVTTLAGSLTLYGSGNATTSMMMFKNTTGLGYGNHGAITGTYNTYFVMDTTDRGWIFRNATTSANIASISNTGSIAASNEIIWGHGYKLSNGNNSSNAEVLSATTGAAGIVLKDSAGNFKMQLYGEGGYYGLLSSEWGAWDLRKAASGELTIYVSGTGQTAIHTGNYGSYALPLSGGVLTGSLTGTDIYHINWIRNHSNNNGHYWSNTGWHLYPQDSTYFYMRSGNTAAVGLSLNAGGTNRGFVYANSSNDVGFLNQAGTWRLRLVGGDGVDISGAYMQLSNSDGYIMGGTVTSRTGSRAIQIGYAGTCLMQLERTGSGQSALLIAASSSHIYQYSRVTGSGTSAVAFQLRQGNTPAYTVTTSGFVAFHQSTSGTSDVLLKKNIQNLDYGLDAINSLTPRSFEWKRDTRSKGKQIGFVAQEVEEVIPELVRGYDGAKSIIETSLISVLTKAIQELSQEVTALRAEVELLKE